MAQIRVEINGRSYEIACDDGEEEHVAELGRYVSRKVGELSAQLGQIGDARLLVMAALLITDELSEAYGALEDTRDGPSGIAPGTDSDTIEGLTRLARRIEDIADGLERA
jgi:cell division protein ZapA